MVTAVWMRYIKREGYTLSDFYNLLRRSNCVSGDVYLIGMSFISFVQDKLFLDYTPVALMKAKKNDVEMKGMRNANVRQLQVALF